MSPRLVLGRVVLPQAMRVIIPPTGNDFINMLKGTSIASVIGFTELIHAANNLSSRSLAVMETLLAVAVWYMVVVSIANVGQYYLERHYNASTRPPAPHRRSGDGSWARCEPRRPFGARDERANTGAHARRRPGRRRPRPRQKRAQARRVARGPAGWTSRSDAGRWW